MSNPGKFEACENETLAQHLNEISLDGTLDNELGDVSDFGWYGLILNLEGIGENKSYIINEDNNGFFTYETFETQDLALNAWSKIESDYEDFTSESENDI